MHTAAAVSVSILLLRLQVSLAAELQQTLVGLQLGGIAHTKINNWVPVSLNLHGEHDREAQRDLVETIRPFHTLLMLPDENNHSKDPLGWNPGDTSPGIARLVKVVASSWSAADPLLTVRGSMQDFS